jgi:DNA-directed RNA polymerase subunit beta'
LSRAYEGIAEIEELRTVEHTDNGGKIDIVVSRLAELRIIDKNTGIAVSTHKHSLRFETVHQKRTRGKKDQLICEWDPYNGVDHYRIQW